MLSLLPKRTVDKFIAKRLGLIRRHESHAENIDANCLRHGRGHPWLDAGECMRSMTEARAKELEGLGHQ